MSGTEGQGPGGLENGGVVEWASVAALDGCPNSLEHVQNGGSVADLSTQPAVFLAQPRPSQACASSFSRWAASMTFCAACDGTSS